MSGSYKVADDRLDLAWKVLAVMMCIWLVVHFTLCSCPVFKVRDNYDMNHKLQNL